MRLLLHRKGVVVVEPEYDAPEDRLDFLVYVDGELLVRSPCSGHYLRTTTVAQVITDVIRDSYNQLHLYYTGVRVKGHK